MDEFKQVALAIRALRLEIEKLPIEAREALAARVFELADALQVMYDYCNRLKKRVEDLERRVA